MNDANPPPIKNRSGSLLRKGLYPPVNFILDGNTSTFELLGEFIGNWLNILINAIDFFVEVIVLIKQRFEPGIPNFEQMNLLAIFRKIFDQGMMFNGHFRLAFCQFLENHTSKFPEGRWARSGSAQ